MMSPTSSCFALNAQVLSAGLFPSPGTASFLANHCVSLEVTFPDASALNSCGVFGFRCFSCAATRVISSRA